MFEDSPQTVYFYNNSKKDHWEFSYDEALQVLEKARLKLATMGKKRE